MSNQLHKIKDHDFLRRDPNTQAILNTNRQEVKEYELKSRAFNTARSVTEEINTIKSKLSEIDSIKSDMREIKELLRGLIK